MEGKKSYRAHARYLHMSASKVRRVADQVRKKPYGDAIAILEALPHKGARLLKKVIQSAAANALGPLRTGQSGCGTRRRAAAC